MIVFSEDFSLSKSYLHGTHRANKPPETWAWLSPKAHAIGVTRIGRVNGLDLIDLPVWIAVRPNARGLSTSQGKGLTDDAARVSAAMESIENWHGENIDLKVRVADWESIRRDAQAMDPELFNYYRDSPPRPDLSLQWVEVFNLTEQSPCWVPYETISTDYVVRSDGLFRPTFVQSSNGLAGGNHVLEALAHGLYEVIERHAIACDIELARSFDSRSRIDPESVQDDACRDVLKRIEAAGCQVAIFSLPSGFGVPVFACSLLQADNDAHWGALPPFNGYGCHLEPSIALLRALTEAVQSRVTHIVGSRDDIPLANYGHGGNPDDLKRYKALFNHPIQGELAYSGAHAYPSFEQDIQYLTRVLASHGHDQILVADLRKQGVDVPVVKVLVPGLSIPQTLIRGRAVRVPRLRDAR